MAMNGTMLGKQIADYVIDANGYRGDPTAVVQITKQWTDIANMIISHIQTNARISTNVTATVAVGIGVQVAVPAGTGSTITPGSATGTGTGTIA